MSAFFAFIGKKVGMTQIYGSDGSLVPVTLLYVGDNYIVDTKNSDRDGYSSVLLGSFEVKEKKNNKPQASLMKSKNLPQLGRLKEFRVPSDISFDVNKSSIDDSIIGMRIDIRSRSKGKGFAGVVKRYGFRGQHASHGESLSERSHGSTGQRQDPGKVFKGKKMAGHMGDRNVCVQNMLVLDVDSSKSLLFVKGSVPGFNGCDVFINTTSKSRTSQDLLTTFNSLQPVKSSS
jgi:large subunit ribosomal protein L3